jgi:hypothetical protein
MVMGLDAAAVEEAEVVDEEEETTDCNRHLVRTGGATLSSFDSDNWHRCVL